MNTTSIRIDKKGFESILGQLTPKEGTIGEYLVTASREEYDQLVRAALVGYAPENVRLGRSGIKLDKKLIIPPDSILCC